MKRIVEFQTFFRPEDRRRHRHVSEGGRMLEFVEQYETFINESWVVVVHYDTAHGFAHKDILRPGGRAIKIRLAATDFKEAMTFASMT